MLMHSKDRAADELHNGQKKHFVPVWLICLVLFSILSVLSIRLIPPFLRRFEEPASFVSDSAEVSFQLSEPAASSDIPAEAEGGLSGQKDSVPSISTSDEEAAARPLSDTGAITSALETSPVSPSVPPVPGTDDGYGIPEWGHIHQYHGGICTVCGQEPELLSSFLPHEFYKKTDRAGTVELHQYEIPAYANGGYGTYNKCFNIYLPWNYDEAKRYNVLVLIHGGGGDQDSWLNDVYPYEKEGIEMCGRVILDNMFEKGICEPCIVVCPVTEIPQCQGLLASTNQLRQELREFILPYVAEHYSTYAEGGSLEAIQSARDHFGLGGLSNGALFVYEGGMRYNYDLFGSYAAFSGNGEPWTTVAVLTQTDRFKDLSMNCYFTGAGTQNDWQQNYTKIGYDYFLEHLPYLHEGKNAWHVDVEGEHEWKVWFTDLFNALPLMFPS